MKYLHDNKIIHGNIKSSNIFIFSRLGVSVFKLCDFGFFDGNKTKSGILETRYFKPPELIEEGRYDYSGDVWQVGVLLFYMTTLVYPFTGETDLQVLEQINKNRILLLPRQIGNNIRELISMMLVKELEDRVTVEQLIQKV